MNKKETQKGRETAMGEKMKKLGLTAVFTAFLALFSVNAQADSLFETYFGEFGESIEVTGGIDYYTKYVWRGFLLDDDSVIQPYVTIAVGGFEGGFWGSFDLESTDSLSSDEVDGWIGYNFDLGFVDESLEMVGLSVGHTWYAFPQGNTGLSNGAHAEEFYFGISLDTFLSPSFTWYHDYSDEQSGGADGDYFAFSIAHSITLDEEHGISLDLGQEIGLNEDAFIVGDGGYSLTTIGLTLPLSESVTAAPVIAYSSPWGEIEDAGNDDEFYTGVSLGFSF